MIICWRPSSALPLLQPGVKGLKKREAGGCETTCYKPGELASGSSGFLAAVLVKFIPVQCFPSLTEAIYLLTHCLLNGSAYNIYF